MSKTKTKATAIPSEMPCLNCGKEFTADDKFCSSCGQKTNLTKITFRDTVKDFASSAFSFEGAFFKTLWMASIRPVRLFEEFLAGKRKKYYKPVPFFIVNTVIYLLLASWIGYDLLDGTNVSLTVDDGVTTLDETALDALAEKAAQFMLVHINHILLILVFSIGFYSKLFFRKRYLLAEYIAISFFIVAIYIAFSNFTMLFATYVYSLLEYFHILMLLGFITVVYPAFFKAKRFGVYLKSFLVALLSFLTYLILGFGISIFWVWSWG